MVGFLDVFCCDVHLVVLELWMLITVFFVLRYIPEDVVKVFLGVADVMDQLIAEAEDPGPSVFRSLQMFFLVHLLDFLLQAFHLFHEITVYGPSDSSSHLRQRLRCF